MSATRPITELPPANVVGLTMVQRKCLVAAERSNGLVLIEGKYRTGYQSGAMRFPKTTVLALMNCGLLMRAGESLAKVTAEGKIEAGRSRAILIEEANKALAEAESRARHLRRESSRKAYFQHRRAIDRQRYLANTAPAGISPEDIAPNWRKPYAD
jgi:hypothetical protein